QSHIPASAAFTSSEARANAATLAPTAFPAAVRACETRRYISTRGAPHTEQYLCPDGNSEPHLAQFISITENTMSSSFKFISLRYHIRCRGLTSNSAIACTIPGAYDFTIRVCICVT